MKQKIEIPRSAVLALIFAVLFITLIIRLYQLQIIKGEEYASNFEHKIKRTVVLKSARGNIYDRNGNLLAGNKLAYTLTLEDNGSYKNNAARQQALNEVAYKLLKVLDNNGEELNSELKILLGTDGNYEYSVDGTQLQRFKADIFGKTKIEDMSSEEAEATANDIIDYMISEDKYRLEVEPYSKKEILDIIGIRYMLSLNAYQKYLPITVAKDVSDETVAYVMENKDILPGADIESDWIRVYDGGEAFAHILGYTGNISTDELEELREKSSAYSARSIVGKSGMEQYLEETLQGTDGEQEVYVDNMGRVLEEGETKTEPNAGKDVYLSIDKELQTAVYQIVEQRIAGILLSNIINAKDFDKSSVKDASDIKIPIYDVYYALINNEIIDINHFSDPGATKLERDIYGRMTNQKEKVLERIRIELEGERTDYKELSKEMQEYESYIINELEILDETALDKKDSVYIAWKKEEIISMNEFLMYGIGKGWVSTDQLTTEKEFLTTQEVYQLVLERILKQLENNHDFDKLMVKYMLKSDVISGKEICRLLYEQGILLKADKDYEALVENNMGAFDFMIKKIKNLEITPAQLALDPCSGSAVIVDTKTGAILASVSYPGYDNNRLANQMDNQYYYQLYNDLSIPFFNRGTQQLTAPGSTIKPITVIAGLQEGVIDRGTSLPCNGVFDKVTPSLRCWKWSGHGSITNAADAIEHSCNDYLCDISYRLGMKERETFADSQALSYLQEYARLFDLDKKSGIEITESEPQVTDHYAIPSAIGQGTHNYSTVQLARYVNTLATKGTSYQLSLMAKEGNSAKVESEIKLPENIWNTVSQGMQQFAGSNETLKDMKIKIAGKSGTAQESEIRPDHALFIGYGPVEDPEISIAVRIANGYASGNAVGVGRDIFSYYFELEKKETILTGSAAEAQNVRAD